MGHAQGFLWILRGFTGIKLSQDCEHNVSWDHSVKLLVFVMHGRSIPRYLSFQILCVRPLLSICLWMPLYCIEASRAPALVSALLLAPGTNSPPPPKKKERDTSGSGASIALQNVHSWHNLPQEPLCHQTHWRVTSYSSLFLIWPSAPGLPSTLDSL